MSFEWSFRYFEVFPVIWVFLVNIGTDLFRYKQQSVSRPTKPHWSVIEHRTRKQDIEVGNYTAQNLENMADLHGES